MSDLRRRLDRGGVALIVSIVVVVLVAIVLIFRFTSQRKPEEIKNFQELVMKVDKLNTQISDREGQIMDYVRKYNTAHPEQAFDTAGIASLGLSPEQAEILQKRVAQEKDVSYRGMLQEVLTLNRQIDELNAEVLDIRSKLPAPLEVKHGDSHFQLCLTFLQGKGVAEDEAMKLIESTALTTELLPGFEVWNYYNDGVFGTFVTQGAAKMSPNALTRSTKRKIETERQTLIQARNAKEEEVKDLESRKSELLGQIKGLEEERNAMLNQMEEMASKNEALAKQLNSLHYGVNTFKEFSRIGVIRKPGLGKWETGDLDAIANPSSIDLRADNRIVFTAASVGLNKISKVLVFPRSYDENADYKLVISDDRQSATLIMQKPDKFHFGKIAIAVD
ncbi:hypothetical protein HZB60_01160 [candidate division KSB1 bacterium]|nr:hypothetical protein [candidate division KSB1 bacterium]